MSLSGVFASEDVDVVFFYYVNDLWVLLRLFC